MSKPLLKFYSDNGFEKAIDALDASENHLILRKVVFPNPSQINILNHSGYEDYSIHRGVYLDTETTGISHSDSEVIQICLLPFIYARSPDLSHTFIIGVYPPYVGFQEPSTPLTQEIIDLTGITMDMLVGQSIDIPQIEDILEKTEFVIAHTAQFDRPFTHGISPKFSQKKWACSLSNVPWREFGFESLKLTHLAADLGFYFEPHQADKDCLAGLAILAQVNAKTKESYFQKMIENAEKDSITIRAQYAPFEAKDVLKQRGYGWKDGSDGVIKGWETVVSVDEAEEEKQWLSDEVYKGAPKFTEKREDAVTRFTNKQA
jgi:DNA polymerase-3 subunit epsilon